jgi:hypothetical protein
MLKQLTTIQPFNEWGNTLHMHILPSLAPVANKLDVAELTAQSIAVTLFSWPRSIASGLDTVRPTIRSLWSHPPTANTANLFESSKSILQPYLQTQQSRCVFWNGWLLSWCRYWTYCVMNHQLVLLWWWIQSFALAQVIWPRHPHFLYTLPLLPVMLSSFPFLSRDPSLHQIPS